MRVHVLVVGLALCFLAVTQAIQLAETTDPVIPPIPTDAQPVGNSESQSTCICKKEPCPPCNPKADALAAKQTAAIAKALKQATKRKQPCISPKVVMIVLNNNEVHHHQQGCPSKDSTTTSSTSQTQSQTHVITGGQSSSATETKPTGDSKKPESKTETTQTQPAGTKPDEKTEQKPKDVDVPSSVLPKDTPAPAPAPQPSPATQAPTPAPVVKNDPTETKPATNVQYKECFPDSRMKEQVDQGVKQYASILEMHPQGPALLKMVKETQVCPAGVTACLTEKSKTAIKAFETALPKEAKVFIASAKTCP